MCCFLQTLQVGEMQNMKESPPLSLLQNDEILSSGKRDVSFGRKHDHARDNV